MGKITTALFRLFSKITAIPALIKANLKYKHYFSITSSAKDVIFGKDSRISNYQHDISKLTIGDGSIIDGIIQVFPYGNGVSIGNNCYVGELSRIWAANRIEIGNNVLISHNVNIIDTDSHEINYQEREESAILQLRRGLPNNPGKVKTAPIIIKDNAWISYNVSILKGVTIGRGAIIGCGSVVTHDIPDFWLAAGNPAKLIKKINE